jgi:hypothetical protein
MGSNGSTALAPEQLKVGRILGKLLYVWTLQPHLEIRGLVKDLDDDALESILDKYIAEFIRRPA